MMYVTPLDLANIMITKSQENFSYRQSFAAERQGSEMAKIIDENDVVFVGYYDEEMPGRVGLVYLKGSSEDLNIREHVDEALTRKYRLANWTEVERDAFEDYLSRTTCLDSQHKAAARAFIEIYNWRQAEIGSMGKVSPHIEAFWDRLTPHGSRHNLPGVPGTFARDWETFKETTVVVRDYFNGIVRPP